MRNINVNTMLDIIGRRNGVRRQVINVHINQSTIVQKI